MNRPPSTPFPGEAMCLHDHTSAPTPSGPISRRNILAGAAALAGISAVSVATQLGGAAPAHADTSGSASSYGRRPAAPKALVIEGATIVDPETGDAVPDGVVVFDRGQVAAAGSGDSTRKAVSAVAGRADNINASGRWIVPGLVDVHVHANALADAQAVLRAGATSVRSGSTSFYQDIALAALPDWAPGASPRMQAAGLF